MSAPGPRFPLLCCSVLLASAVAWRPAAAHVTVLTAGDPLAEGVAKPGWRALDASAGSVLAAPDHPLQPRLSPATGELSVELGPGSLHFRPLSLTARTGLPLPLAPAGALAGSPPGGPLLRLISPWQGIEELYLLRPTSVKHDLLVPREMLERLGVGDLRVSWHVKLPPGVTLALDDSGGASLRDARGKLLARVPAPAVAEGEHPHWRTGIARLETSGDETEPVLTLVVPASWARDPARAFPLWLDPTVEDVRPSALEKTGFVDESPSRLNGLIDSGSLSAAFFGADARGFAEFDTSSIPDDATILDVDLRVMLSNHRNPLRVDIEPVAEPLDIEIHALPLQVEGASDVDLHAAIGGMGMGVVYASDTISETGLDFCPDSFEERIYDLGALADADLEARLPDDFFSLGFASSIGTDTDFDHVDYIGFDEVTGASSCRGVVPDSQIRLIVLHDRPPSCDAGGPYTDDCGTTSFPLSGSATDPDGDELTYRWTTDCPGRIDDADRADASLVLDAGCSATCTVTLEVSDGFLSTSCTAPVTVGDSTPPEVVLNRLADGLCLWPPRHDMFCLPPADEVVEGRDECGDVRITYVACSSDQPDEAREEGRPENGDGHFPEDCQPLADGRLCVRAERAGNDPGGRTYGAVIELRDECGNVTRVETGPLFVPHDRRGGIGPGGDPCERGGRAKHVD